MAKKTTKKKPAAKKPAAKKTAPKKAGSKKDRSHFIAKAPVRRLMKQEGASLVSQDALMLMIDTPESHAEVITKKAIKLVIEDGRKRVTPQDIDLAIR
jgi:histone H3/H4